MSEKIGDDENKKLTRRELLRGGLAVAAAGAVIGNLPSHASETGQSPAIDLPPAAERERIIGEVVSAFSSPDTKRILENGTDEEIIRLLHSYPEFLVRADSAYFAETTFDPMPFLKNRGFPSAQLREIHADESFASQGDHAFGNLDERTIRAFASGGNAFVVEYERDRKKSFAVLTNKHVADPLKLPSVSRTHEDIDIAALEVSVASRGLPAALPWDRTRLGSDLTGSLVFNPVIKSDPSAPDHFKIRAGIAFKVTSHMVDFILRNSPFREIYQQGKTDVSLDVWKKQLARSYITVSPLWEQAPQTAAGVVAGDVQSVQFTYGQGTSGSPWMKREESGDLKVAGVHYAGFLLNYGPFERNAIGISVFHGPDEIEETLASIP